MRRRKWENGWIGKDQWQSGKLKGGKMGEEGRDSRNKECRTSKRGIKGGGKGKRKRGQPGEERHRKKARHHE